MQLVTSHRRIVNTVPYYSGNGSNVSVSSQRREEVIFDSVEKNKHYQTKGDSKSPVTSFSIHNFLSPQECKYYIKKGGEMGFDELLGEYPAQYRNSMRCLVRCEELAASLFQRLKYGFQNSGKWIPVGLNDVFKLSCYPPQSHFSPHYDGCFVVNDGCRSIFTLLVYLNDNYEGGTTDFRISRKFGTVSPQKGKAVIFNHNVTHSGNLVTSGYKYVMKTEVLFRRADMPLYPPPALMSLRSDPLYKEAVELYNLSSKLESQGDVLGSTSAYLKALDIQINLKPSQSSVIVGDKESDPTVLLSIDIFAKFFRYLDTKTTINCIMVSRRWQKIGLDGQIWMQKYSEHFPVLFLAEKSVHHSFADQGFLSDWYQTYKIGHLLRARKHQAICIDFGNTYTKVAKGDERCILPTIIGTENHPHYMITGQGYSSNWRAGNDVFHGGTISDVMEPFVGDDVDWDGMWLMTNQVYTDLCSQADRHKRHSEVPKLDSRLYPVILAEGVTPFDRKQVEKTMFELMQVPSLCIVNSAVLSLYSIGRDTGVVVDFGRLRTTFTPVWHGEVLRDKITTYPIATALVLYASLASVDSRNNSAGIDMRLYQPPETDMLRATLEYDEKSEESITINRRTVNTYVDSRAPEILFNSTMLGSDIPAGAVEVTSVVGFVYNSILACDANKTEAFFNCIFLVGGGAQITGVQERFESDFKKLRTQCRIVSDTPCFSAVNGGINYAKSTQYLPNCRTRLEYMISKAKEDPTPASTYDVVETKVLGSLTAKFKKLFKK